MNEQKVIDKFNKSCKLNKYNKAKRLLKNKFVQDYVRQNANPLVNACDLRNKKIAELLLDNNVSLKPYLTEVLDWNRDEFTEYDYPMDSLLKLNDKDLIKKGLSLGGEFSKYAVNVYKVYNKENVDPELLDIVEEQVEDSTIKQQKKKGNSEKHSRVKVEDNQSEAGLSR